MEEIKIEDGILEDQILDWDACFNCVFAEYKRGKFQCEIKHLEFYKKTQKNKNKKEYRKEGTDVCEYIIKRPKGSAEIYQEGKPIIYRVNEKGLADLNNEEKRVYEEKIRDIGKKLDLPRLLSYINKITYRWTFASSKIFVIERDQYLNQSKKKYVCYKCKKKVFFNEMEIHHIIERCNNGTDSPANLMVLCNFCHDQETWKLMTGRIKVPIIIQWRILIRAKYTFWRGKYKYTRYKLRKLIDEKEYLEKLKEPYFIQRKEDLDNIKRKLVNLKVKYKGIRRKYKFWKKYLKKTKEWNIKLVTKIRLKDKLIKQHKTLDKFW